MNRQDLITRTLMLESVAAEAKARAQRLRDMLADDARAELLEQGTAPTWRIPDIGTVTLPVSTEAAYVSDEPTLIEWVKVDYPTEVETLERVRPAFLAALLDRVQPAGGGVVDPDTGRILPGLSVRPGGQPKALSFRPSRDAQAVAKAAAVELVEDVEHALGGPLILAENPDA